jgi:hypothetical protein
MSSTSLLWSMSLSDSCRWGLRTKGRHQRTSRLLSRDLRRGAWRRLGRVGRAENGGDVERGSTGGEKIRSPYRAHDPSPNLVAGARSHMDFLPTTVKPFYRPTYSKHSPESRHWRQYKNPVFIKEYAPITSIHFSTAKPHRYAVTAATRVQVYTPRTQKITRTISRFKDVARSGNIRPDGKLVIAGDDSGLVQVRSCSFCDLTKYALLLSDFRHQLQSDSSYS